MVFQIIGIALVLVGGVLAVQGWLEMKARRHVEEDDAPPSAVIYPP